MFLKRFLHVTWNYDVPWRDIWLQVKFIALGHNMLVYDEHAHFDRGQTVSQISP